ncbi:glycosyltransferase family 58 protein [Ramaria rubella]|nr:glycosyltransferase family 58 protein [Ramaria rubella]
MSSLAEVGVRWSKELFLNGRYFWAIAVAVLVGDAALTQLIIRHVPYTEIDFQTYMYHVELYSKGERDYSMIIGPSGPLVYPAGHVFIHRLLSHITSGGYELRLAQQIYGSVYLTSLVLTCAIYRQAGHVPNYVLLLLPLSKRLHSLFMLRLFNDCWALVTVQIAILALATGWDDIASVLFSAALSVKMSILLYMPGLLLLLFKRHGLLHTLRQVTVIMLFQALVALPFISAYPWSYISYAFEFSRVFFYTWTVNWRFIPEDVFLSRPWALILLTGHLCTLIAFAFFKWCQGDGGIINVLTQGLRTPRSGASNYDVAPDQIIVILFTCNLIGIIFARSLHYQFYSWYAQQIPFLLWQTRYPTIFRFAILASIEYAWNVFPSTTLSSAALLISNLALLIGIWFGFPEGKEVSQRQTKQRKSA